MTAREGVERQLQGIHAETLRRFLFLVDPNGLTEGLERAAFGQTSHDAFRFANALELRDRLEELKDADAPAESFPLAVVICRSESELDATVVDLTSRGATVVVSPQSVLQTLEPDAVWSDEFNFLNGGDFSERLDAILSTRRRWERDPSADEVPLFIAECALNQPLREKLPPDTALALWERLVGEPDSRAFFERNPRALLAVHRQIQRSAPIETKLELDPDFAVFLWTTYFVQKYVRHSELFASEFFGRDVWAKYGVHETDAVRETCERILAENPQRAVSQVRSAERSLTESPHRERLFLSLLGLDGRNAVTEALRIASEETVSSFLTEACLRVLIPRVASGDAAFTPNRVRRLRAALERKHLANRFPQYYERLRGLTALLRALLGLAERVEIFHSRQFERDLPILPISAWTDELYPNHLVPLGLLVDEVAGKTAETASLVGGAPIPLVREAERIRRRADVLFARLVRSNYVRWLAQHAPPPLLTVDFLDTVFIPYWQRLRRETRSPLLALCLFHGLRWDEWTTLAPLFSERLRRHRCVETRAVMTLLPSTRAYNTGALILGRFPSLADSGTVSALISERLAAEGIPFAETVLDPRNGMPDVKEGVVLVNVAASETGARKTRPTGESAARIREETDALLGGFLSRVPASGLVIAVSNGGTTEVTGPASPVREGVVDIQPRWVGLDGLSRGQSFPPDVAFFNAEATRLPNPSVVRCAFAPPGVWFSSDARDSARRYLCGGISLDEMLVPCAVFAPKRFDVRLDDAARDS